MADVVPSPKSERPLDRSWCTNSWSSCPARTRSSGGIRARAVLLLGPARRHTGCDAWLDCHVHEFRLLDAAGRTVVSIGIPTDDDPEERPLVPGWKCPCQSASIGGGQARRASCIAEVVAGVHARWSRRPNKSLCASDIIRSRFGQRSRSMAGQLRTTVIGASGSDRETRKREPSVVTAMGDGG